MAAAAIALVVPRPGAAQLAEEVARVEDGVVSFSFETRPEVEICDQGIRIGERHMWWNSRGEGDRERNCRFGPAEVELEVRDGLVMDVEVVRDHTERGTDVADLGEVSPEEAASFLLSLAYDGANEDGAKEAVFPAMLANVEGVWRELLEIARDRGVYESVRENALFWLGQEAADAVTAGLTGVALDEDEDQDVRDSAIFALSQRPHDEGIPALMEVARAGKQSKTRRTAMFWLAQSEDERVLAFFEEILLGRTR